MTSFVTIPRPVTETKNITMNEEQTSRNNRPEKY